MRLYKSQPPAILKKLTIDEATWIETVSSFTAQFHVFVGPEETLSGICQKQGKKWLKGIHLCRQLFAAPRLGSS